MTRSLPRINHIDTSDFYALAWLLRRSPNILLIRGTSSTAHLREDLAAATLALSEEEQPC